MAHPMTTQIKLEFAATLRKLGRNTAFRIKINPAEDGFCEAVCVDEKGNLIGGVKTVRFRPTITDSIPAA
ncbi:MAG: hypothetical protein PHQ42_03455 [Patescibacteria group bacterium]|nr:hypothetical protein [Patescibacteria group bacterium]